MLVGPVMFGTVAFAIAAAVGGLAFSGQAASAPSVKALTLTIRDPHVGRLSFQAIAAGDPAAARTGRLVLFLHGFPETADSFRQILPAVASAGYYAVAFSQRGYSPGARPRSVAAYNIIDLVGDVTRVAARLGARSFHLVGHDWGGGVAWVAAALYPGLVSSVMVLATPYPDALSAAITDPENPQHAASAYMAVFREPGSARRILSDGVEGFKALFALGGGVVTAATIDAYARTMATPAALGAAMNWYRANPFPTPALGTTKVRAVYLWGSGDATFLLSTAQATAQYVKGPYTFCELPGKGHWLPEDAGPQIVQALLPELAGRQPRCPAAS
jgi:pimeloyl-ACP methyl ester carboxylesterase